MSICLDDDILLWFLIESTAGLLNDDDVLYCMLLAPFRFLRIYKFRPRKNSHTKSVLTSFGENLMDVAFAV
jgi:hypothetical protein